MVQKYSAFGRSFSQKPSGVEYNLAAMARITGINWTAFVNTKLAEHFGLKPIHETFGGDRCLSPEDESQFEILRAQYLSLGSKSGFNAEKSATDELLAIIRSCKAEIDRREATEGAVV